MYMADHHQKDLIAQDLQVMYINILDILYQDQHQVKQVKEQKLLRRIYNQEI